MKKGLESSGGIRGKLVGKVVYLAAFFGPLTIIPQVAEIWFVDHSAKGVSLITRDRLSPRSSPVNATEQAL